MAVVEQKEGYALLHVRVQPKASRNAVCIAPEGRIRVALTAPPVAGAANKALRAFLSKALGIPKTSISLAHGEKTREKTLRLEGCRADEIKERLGL